MSGVDRHAPFRETPAVLTTGRAGVDARLELQRWVVVAAVATLFSCGGSGTAGPNGTTAAHVGSDALPGTSGATSAGVGGTTGLGGATSVGGTTGSGGSNNSGSGGVGAGASGAGGSDSSLDAGAPTGGGLAGGASSGTVVAFTLTSDAFREGGMIPLTYRCMHENVSPPLSWTAGPTGTRSYAVTMIHAIEDLGLHWVLWDIPADTRALAVSVPRVAEPPTPAGSKQVRTNIDGAAWFGYVGPCPHGPSSNLFAVYALDVVQLQGVTTQSTPTQVDALIRSHSLARATLTGATD